MVKFLLFILLNIVSATAIGQTVAFTYASQSESSLCSPDTINFTPVCTGNPIGYTWYFGNGQTSNSAIPSVVFSAGIYEVKLVAVFANVALESIQTITVNPDVNLSVTASAAYICKLDTINFSTTTNANNPSYLFDFGDGTNSISTPNNAITHAYTSFGTYNTTIKVISSTGCADSVNYEVEVKKPPITATVDPENGCAPVTVNFNASVLVPTGSSVVDYAWSFGDGSATLNSTNSNVPHPYADSGTYTPTLSITTIEGCTNDFTFPTLYFGLAPFITNAYPKKLVYCGNETAILVGVANNANSYKWEYGDGVIDIISDTITSHRYQNLGIKTVKVTPIYNNCFGTPYIFTVEIIGVIANFSYGNFCVIKNRFNLNNTSQGNQSLTRWIFDDGSADAFSLNALHTYPVSGTFITNLIVKDNITGCADTIAYPIFTARPVLANADTFLCRNASTTFTLLNDYANPGAVHNWYVQGLPPGLNLPSPYTVSSSIHGNFNNNFVVIENGMQYCPDTAFSPTNISVRGPNLSYFTSTSFCTNNNFIITNTSIPFLATDTIKSWNWTFGIPGLQDTQYQPAPYVYTAEGTYLIRLIAKDKKGCIDSLEKNILVKESPFLRIFPRSAVVCLGETITLTAYHTDTLVWLPANLVNCATCDTTIATPTVSTKIYAMASNAIGCSLKDSTIITVLSPFTATANANNVFACRNDTVSIGVNPPNKKVLWTPSLGLSNNTAYQPIATVIKDTSIYTAALIDSAGCYSSEVAVKVISHPLAIVNAGPDRILSYNSPFTIIPTYGADINSYLWTPAGNLNCTNCPKPSGFADSTRNYIIKVTTSKNCVANDTLKIALECAYANLFMASAFSPENTTVKKYYYPQTRGIKMINRFAIFNRYGEIIYEVKNASPNTRDNGWDGKYKGIDQTPGGYVYMLKAICEKGELLNKKGSFLLLR